MVSPIRALENEEKKFGVRVDGSKIEGKSEYD
jgi:hypothetical protein